MTHLQIISYTFPYDPTCYPYIDVLKYGERYVDYFHVYRAMERSIDHTMELGIPAEKVGSAQWMDPR